MQKLILGSGSWGSVIAQILAKKNPEERIFLWGRSEENFKHFQKERILSRPVRHQALPNIELINSLNKFKRDKSRKLLLIYALPSVALELGISLVKSFVLDNNNSDLEISFLSAAKGLHAKSGKRISEVWQEHFPEQKLAVISGPNLAKEAFEGKPMQTVIASKESKYLSDLSELFSSENFRVQTSTDLLACEFFGAFKNIFSLGAGAWDALELGNSGKGAFLTICFKELIDLVEILGGKKDSAYLASGFGDFFITCTSTLSRNYQTGYYFAKGRSLVEISSQILGNQVSEGLQTSQISEELIRKSNYLSTEKENRFKTFALIRRIFSLDQTKPDFQEILIQEFENLLAQI